MQNNITKNWANMQKRLFTFTIYWAVLPPSFFRSFQEWFNEYTGKNVGEKSFNINKSENNGINAKNV